MKTARNAAFVLLMTIVAVSLKVGVSAYGYQDWLAYHHDCEPGTTEFYPAGDDPFARLASWSVQQCHGNDLEICMSDYTFLSDTCWACGVDCATVSDCGTNGCDGWCACG